MPCIFLLFLFVCLFKCICSLYVYWITQYVVLTVLYPINDLIW